MNDGFTWWLVVLGIAVGVGLVWVFTVRLPRGESDVGAAELPVEADWISRNIEVYGGIAPQPLVEEVLELHRQYLATGATPLPPAWRPAVDGDDGPGAASVSTPGPPLERGPAAEPEPAADSEQEPTSSGN